MFGFLKSAIFYAPDEPGGGGEASVSESAPAPEPNANVTSEQVTTATPGANTPEQNDGEYKATDDKEVARYKGVMAKQQKHIGSLQEELAKYKQQDTPPRQEASRQDTAEDASDVLKHPLLRGMRQRSDEDGNTYIEMDDGTLLLPAVALSIAKGEMHRQTVDKRLDTLQNERYEREQRDIAEKQYQVAEEMSTHIITKMMSDYDKDIVTQIGIPIVRAMVAESMNDGVAFDGELVEKASVGAATLLRKLIAHGVESHTKKQSQPQGQRIAPTGVTAKPNRQSSWDVDRQGRGAFNKAFKDTMSKMGF